VLHFALLDPHFRSALARRQGPVGCTLDQPAAHVDSIGVAIDKAEAARWYRVAADRGHAPAMINLAALLLTGLGADRTAAAASAATLVRRAADAGSIDCLFDMGHLSESGTGVAKDMAEAQRWYRLAADRKDSRAMLRLGVIHADGIGGMPRDDAEAARWLVAGVAPLLRIVAPIMRMYAMDYGFNDPTRRVAPRSLRGIPPARDRRRSPYPARGLAPRCAVRRGWQRAEERCSSDKLIPARVGSVRSDGWLSLRRRQGSKRGEVTSP